MSGQRTKIIVTAVAGGLLLVLLAVVLVRHGHPFSADLTIHRWAVTHRPRVAREIAVAITDTGIGLVPYALAAIAGLILGGGTRERTLRAVWAMLVLLVFQMARLGLAELVRRHRPPAADWAAHVSGFAFPSGHTVTSATAAGILIWALWRSRRTVLVSCVALWAIAVGLTRVYLGVHWPTDVVGGWLMTLTMLGLMTLASPSGLLPPDPSLLTSRFSTSVDGNQR